VGKYALQITKSSGSTTGDYFLQRIENVKSVTGELTYSLSAKADAATDITVYARQHFGTGGSPSEIVDLLFGTISVPSGSTFEKYSLTETLQSLAGKTVGTNNNDYVEFYALISNSSNATLTLTNVQVEAGTVATPFRRNAPSIQAELAACQRYFQRINSETSSGLYWSIFQALSTTATVGSIWLTTTMRSSPTVSFSSPSHFFFANSVGSGLNATAMTATVTSPNFFRVSGTVASGLVAGNATLLSTATSSAFIEASSEL
jgi:hypothetical protein